MRAFRRGGGTTTNPPRLYTRVVDGWTLDSDPTPIPTTDRRFLMPRLLECRCGAIVEEVDGVRYDWLSHRLHPVHLTVIPGGRG